MGNPVSWLMNETLRWTVVGILSIPEYCFASIEKVVATLTVIGMLYGTKGIWLPVIVALMPPVDLLWGVGFLFVYTGIVWEIVARMWPKVQRMLNARA